MTVISGCLGWGWGEALQRDIFKGVRNINCIDCDNNKIYTFMKT